MARETINSRVAVLETQVDNIEKKVDVISQDIRDLHACIHKNRELIISEIRALREADNSTHKEMNQRIMTLENWRWYVIGIATVLAVVAKWLFGV